MVGIACALRMRLSKILQSPTAALIETSAQALGRTIDARPG